MLGLKLFAQFWAYLLLALTIFLDYWHGKDRRFRLFRENRRRIVAVLAISFVASMSLTVWNHRTAEQREDALRARLAGLENELAAADRRGRFAARLDDRVQSIQITVTLARALPFSQLSPFEMGFLLLSRDETGTLRSLNIAVRDCPVTTGQTGTKLSGYQVSWLLSDGQSQPEVFQFFPFEETVRSIPVPVSYHGGSGRPLSSIRSFHAALFNPHLPTKLIDVAKDVELWVNGWILVRASISQAFWQPTEVGWSLFRKEPLTLSTPFAGDFHGDRPPRGLWWIDLNERVPEYRN